MFAVLRKAEVRPLSLIVRLRLYSLGFSQSIVMTRWRAKSNLSGITLTKTNESGQSWQTSTYQKWRQRSENFGCDRPVRTSPA